MKFRIELKQKTKFRIVAMTQEISTVSSAEGKLDYDKYPIGSMLFIYPFHVRVDPIAVNSFY